MATMSAELGAVRAQLACSMTLSQHVLRELTLLRCQQQTVEGRGTQTAELVVDNFNEASCTSEARSDDEDEDKAIAALMLRELYSDYAYLW